MVKLTIDDRKYEFPSEFNELTLKQLDEISAIFDNRELTNAEQWISIISYLAGIRKESIEDWPVVYFKDICNKMFTKDPSKEESLESVDTVEIDGILYKARDFDSISARESAEIERAFSTTTLRITKVTAMIYQREGSTRKEHISELQDRVKKFQDLNAAQFTGRIAMFSTSFLKNLQPNEG